MSRSITLPNPSHSGQAPSGLLKLNSRGSGTGYSRPQSSQRSVRLNVSRHQGRPSNSNAAPRPPAVRSRPLGQVDQHMACAVAFGERRFDRVAKPLRRRAAGGEPIDDDEQRGEGRGTRGEGRGWRLFGAAARSAGEASAARRRCSRIIQVQRSCPSSTTRTNPSSRSAGQRRRQIGSASSQRRRSERTPT